MVFKVIVGAKWFGEQHLSDLLTNTLWQCGGAGFVWLSCTRTIQLYRDTPAIQGHSSCTGTLQFYRDAPAIQVSGAEVAGMTREHPHWQHPPSPTPPHMIGYAE